MIVAIEMPLEASSGIDLDRLNERKVRSVPAWVVAILITICYVVATTDLKARETWNSFDKDIVDNLTERVEEGQASRQIGFAMLGLVGAALCVMPTTKKFSVDYRLLYPLAVFVAWILLSVVWSTERDLTLKRQIVFVCVALTVVGYWRHYRARDLATLAFIGSTSICVLGILYELFAGSVKSGVHDVYRFCGTMHPNHQGINAVLMMLSSLALFDRTKLKRFLLLAVFAFGVLLMTKSRTALIAGVIASLVFAVLRLPRRTTMIGGVALACIAGVIFLLSNTGVMSGVSDFLEMGRTDSDAGTLTGRTDIWKYAFALMNADPVRWITGFGYQSFWTADRTGYISDHVYFHISEGHSAYFDTLLDSGFVGLCLYAPILFASAIKWLWLAHRRNSGALAFLGAMLVFAMIHSFTESTTVAPNFPTFFSFAAIAAAALFTPKRDVSRLEDA